MPSRRTDAAATNAQDNLSVNSRPADQNYSQVPNQRPDDGYTNLPSPAELSRMRPHDESAASASTGGAPSLPASAVADAASRRMVRRNTTIGLSRDGLPPRPGSALAASDGGQHQAANQRQFAQRSKQGGPFVAKSRVKSSQFEAQDAAQRRGLPSPRAGSRPVTTQFKSVALGSQTPPRSASPRAGLRNSGHHAPSPPSPSVDSGGESSGPPAGTAGHNVANPNYSVIPLPEAANAMPDAPVDPRTRSYFADVARTGAENKLRGRPPGTFLVRPSTHAAFALSFVTDKMEIGHSLLHQEPGGWRLENMPDLHTSLDKLLAFYPFLGFKE